MREHPGARDNPLDWNDAMVRGDRDSSRKADAAGDASLLANSSLGRFRVNPDDLGPRPLRWAEGDALEVAALGLAPILEHDGDAHYPYD